MAYDYPVDECDVTDKVGLVAYRTKREEWLHMLDGDQQHSVSKQISEMLWGDLVYRTVNEARRLAVAGDYKSSALNWSIARFVDQGYVATQTLAIRKLLEPAWRKPEKQVISLRRVIDEIAASRHLLTRENYVAHDGLVFDPAPVRAAYEARILARGSGVFFDRLPTTGRHAWGSSERAHESFDKLSGVGGDQRSRGDLIAPAVFERIESELLESGCSNIAEIANKFIAHAADELSRSTLSEDQKEFTLAKIERCHRAICRTTGALFGPILWQGSHGLFPIPQFNYFENLGAIWLRDADVSSLHGFWDAHVAKVEGWSDLLAKEPNVLDEVAAYLDARPARDAASALRAADPDE